MRDVMRSTFLIPMFAAFLCFAPQVAHAERSAPNVLPACDVLHAGLGPVIGWSFGKGTEHYRLFGGFEATGGCPWLRLSIGGVFRRAPPGQAPESIYWTAWEPGLGLGATVGVSYSSELGVLPALGGWLGGAVPITDEFRYEQDKDGPHGVFSVVCASLSVGVRVRFGGGEKRTDLYVAPKVQYCTYPQIHT